MSGYTATKYDVVDRAYSPGKSLHTGFRSKRKARSAKRKKQRFNTLENGGKCTQCGKICLKEGALKEHFIFFHSDKILRCAICDQVFQRAPNIIVHIRTMHLNGLDPLEGVHFSYIKKSSMTTEQRAQWKMKTEQMLKTVELESPSTPTTGVLVTIKAFNCHDCDAKFSKIGELFNHCKTVHRISDTGKPFPYLVPVKMSTKRRN